MNDNEPLREDYVENDSCDTTEDIASLRERLEAAEQQARSYMMNWQRTQADLENYKRRAQIERREATDLAHSTLVARLLAALDDLDRAFSRPPAEMRKASWTEGARMSYEKLKSALEAEGIKPIEALGQPFDPRYHQAVMRQPGEEGIVLEEVQKGYTLNDRVIRPSMVVVGTQELSEDDNEEDTQ